MDEYIKRSEVVGLVEDKLKRCDTVLETLAFASLRTKVMGLRSADVEPMAGWISVEERLPEPYTWVMVYNPNGKYTKIDTDEIVGGNWVRNCGKVTHWMTLPEPPGMKGGGAE